MKYSKSSDVYSFAILMCEIMNNKDSLKNNSKYIKANQNGKNEGQRPILRNTVADCYRNLIHRCWAQNPEDRPTFDEIVNELKTNKEFITEGIDSEEFNNYIKFIEESEKSFSDPKPHQKLYESFKNYIHTFDKTKINLELRGPSFSGDDLNLTKYKLNEYQIIEKNGYKLQKVLPKDEKKYTLEEKLKSLDSNYSIQIHFYSHIYSKEIHDFSQHEIVNFVRKLSILSRINHPAIINFVGYSPIDFNNKSRPVILTEFFNKMGSRILSDPTR